MTDQRSLILAIALSLVVLVGWQVFYDESSLLSGLLPKQPGETVSQAQPGKTDSGEVTPSTAPPTGAGAPSVPGASAPQMAQANREAALAASPRVVIAAKRLSGSIALRDGRIDDVTLTDYFETLDADSERVTLLSPTDAPAPYHATFGWISADNQRAVPVDALWQADRSELTTEQPVTLSWDNGEGLRFERVYALDENYMFTITQRVLNSGDQPVTLRPYGLILRTGTPVTTNFYILHEGPIGVLNEQLKEIDYDDVVDAKAISESSVGGWVGITDKYWLTALIPDKDQPFTASFRNTASAEEPRYQVDYLREAITVAAGERAEVTDLLFVGAKEVALLDGYEEKKGIPLFDHAVDFGYLYFLTKPIFHVLRYFHGIIGNFGLSILALTVCVKLIFFPLANKSYKAMSRMKALQPEMAKLRERYSDDRQKMNSELMTLYKSKKVNPASGCLPILVQIPVFFALYKVLFVAIEMRHAPFYGWIHDLSAPDPTTVFNLFGLIPFDPPQFLMIGIWPLLMGGSMYFQQLLNPQPADPVQAKVFKFMPLFFMFLLASFPAGLVIYWTWNNLLSMTQQYVIMKRMGVPIGAKI